MFCALKLEAEIMDDPIRNTHGASRPRIASWQIFWSPADSFMQKEDRRPTPGGGLLV